LVATGFGALHAFIPHRHGSPVLVPLAAKRASSLAPGAAFALGVTFGSMESSTRGAFGQAILKDLLWTEKVLGVAMIAFGVFYVASPRWVHAGHLHGGCQPHDARDAERPLRPWRSRPGPASRGAEESPRRRIPARGPQHGGATCFSNATGLALALESKSARDGGVLLGVFGLSAGLTTMLLLALVVAASGFSVDSRPSAWTGACSSSPGSRWWCSAS
jgi:hypothetical protein